MTTVHRKVEKVEERKGWGAGGESFHIMSFIRTRHTMSQKSANFVLIEYTPNSKD